MDGGVHGSLCDPSLRGFQGTPLASTTLSLGHSVQILEALPPLYPKLYDVIDSLTLGFRLLLSFVLKTYDYY